MPRRFTFILALAVLAFASPVFAASSTPGSLVRIAANPAVYYVADDGKRHVFPDAGTYASWFSDFSAVKVISAPDMAAMPLGRNVTRKPGVRMVKIQTDTKVYAVGGGGALRWVKDEDMALALYGTGWNRVIDDVSDAFFVDYYLGDDIASISDFNTKAVGITTIDEDLRARTGAAILATPGKLTITAHLPNVARATVLGAIKAELSGLDLAAPSDVGADVVSLRLVGYIDQGQGDVDFQLGSDADTPVGTLSFLSDLVPRVGLYDEIGNIVAGPVSVTIDGSAVFTSFNFPLAAGQRRTLYVRGDVSRGATIGGVAERLSFDIASPGAVGLQTAQGANVTASVSLPNGGATPISPTTVRRTGTMTFAWIGMSGYGISGGDALVGTLTATASGDDYEIRTLSFPIRAPMSSVRSMRLEMDGGSPVTVPYEAADTFDALHVPVTRGQTVNFRLYATLRPPADGAERSDVIRADFNSNGPLLFVSASSGDSFREGAIGGDEIKLTASRLSAVQVRFTQMSASKLSDTPVGSVGRNVETEVLRFGLSANAADPVRVRQLSFRITPNDVNTTGSSNDLLEKWADAVGAGDADAIATLRWSGDNYESALGESGNPIRVIYGEADRSDHRVSAPLRRATLVGDSGIITYVFPENYETVIPAGRQVSFRLFIDTTKFLPGPKSFSIQLLGGTDMAWVDGLEGFPAATIDGTTVVGVPTAPSTLAVP